MNVSLAGLTAQPKPLRVRIHGEERTYLIHPLTLHDLGQLQAWVDSQFPDPFELVREAIQRHPYTVVQQQYLMSQAIAAAGRPPRLMGSPEADQVLYTLPGQCELLKLSIRKGRPDFSDDEARELYMHLTIADLAKLHNQTGIDLVSSDPKAGPTTSGETGSKESRRRRRRGSTSGKSSTS